MYSMPKAYSERRHKYKKFKYKYDEKDFKKMRNFEFGKTTTTI